MTAGQWTELARRLADELADAGKLSDPAWREAVSVVPRHLLTPTCYSQDNRGKWSVMDTSTVVARREWLEKVYSNTVLVTALDTATKPPMVLSTSSQPGLMTRMLEALDVRDGMDVLEIGTGTGYNAALLAHRLGDEHVCSIDVEPALVEDARVRLDDIGYRPSLAVGDGAEGWPEHAPYDRVIATCSVSRVPWAWVEQTKPGGVVLADLKPGSLVRLTRHDDRAEGRFDPVYAAFMALRRSGDIRPEQQPKAAQDRARVTVAPPRPFADCLVVWFLACVGGLPIGVRHGYTLDDDTREPTAATLLAPDGSWCAVDIALDRDGVRHVREGGPTPLWQHVEHAHQRWLDADRPGWDRLGLTMTDNTQTVWLDRPGNPLAILT